jgi:hypothetical protein
VKQATHKGRFTGRIEISHDFAQAAGRTQMANVFLVNDIWCFIASNYMPPSDVGRLEQTCKYFRTLISSKIYLLLVCRCLGIEDSEELLQESKEYIEFKKKQNGPVSYKDMLKELALLKNEWVIEEYVFITFRNILSCRILVNPIKSGRDFFLLTSGLFLWRPEQPRR